VIIVDDRLCVEALAGRPITGSSPATVVATTWGFHFRLLRALADDRTIGALTRATPDDIRRGAANPSPGLLFVLDPRPSTAIAAEVAVRHGLNLLASEMVAAAKLHSARVVLSAANVGRRWREVLDAEGISLHVV
jgi:hypothetical protein